MNVTVDDARQLIAYDPPGIWIQNAVCETCFSSDPAKMLDLPQASLNSTWTMANFDFSAPVVGGGLTFQGTAIHAYFVAIYRDRLNPPLGPSSLRFLVDGELHTALPVDIATPPFSQLTDPTIEFLPSLPLFSVRDLPIGQHSLRFEWTHQGVLPPIVLALDYLEYTTLDASASGAGGAARPTAPVSPTGSSSSFSSAQPSPVQSIVEAAPLAAAAPPTSTSRFSTRIRTALEAPSVTPQLADPNPNPDDSPGPSPTGSQSDSGGGLPIGVIVGAALGGAALLFLIIFAICCFRRRRSANRKKKHKQVTLSMDFDCPPYPGGPLEDEVPPAYADIIPFTLRAHYGDGLGLNKSG
ncbi:hypothetical protein FA15DRAFT_48953 [Coprinopsis marcescibilis]|uniref:Uncharacterized protein n=1 Tax=Coprinopsis marcescibilis TaxID=230819 RepID=A0A5C3KQU0_COPMA|nr:hypothetical protein FA15DRAFT_48953 [Coprinopsis marcescibilis]